MARFWTCPKCGERCIAKNQHAHAVSDYCRLLLTKRRRKEAGFGIISLQWVRILHDADVPIEKDIVRLDGIGRKYDQKAEEGFWAPDWACMLLNSTVGGKCTRTTRVIILHHLQRNPDLAKAVVPAKHLTDWQTVYEWLFKEIRGRLPRQRKKRNKE